MKVKIKIVLILSSIFLLSGCWNYNELNSLAIATGMAIDKDGDNFKVSVLIANSKKQQASALEGEAQSVVVSGIGKTITDAMRDAELVVPKKLYISHLSVVVLSEDIAKDNLESINDYFLRNPASIKRFYAVIAEDSKASDILKVISPLESFPSQNIYTNIRVSSSMQALSTIVPYSNFVETLIRRGQEAYLPLITVKGNTKEGSSEEGLKSVEPKAILKIENIALFKDNKMVKLIENNDESKGINIVLNNVDEMTIQAPCNKGYVNSVINSISTTVKSKLKNNTPHVTIHVKGIARMNEISCKVDLQDKKVLENLETNIEQKIREIVLRGVKVSQNNKSDIFGFGNNFYKKYPKYFNENEKNWNDKIFPSIHPIIDINIHLVSKGSIQDTIKEDTHAN